MSQDTLSALDVKKLFGKPKGATYTDIYGIDPATPISVGSRIRIVLLNEPTWIDSLNDDAQENAEEHTQEILDGFGQAGIVVFATKVQGVDAGQVELTEREAYCYDLEVVAVIEPAAPLKQELAGFAGLAQAVRLGALAAAALTGLLLASTLAYVVVVGPGEGGKLIGNTVFWISAAVIAAAVAVAISKARRASSG